MRRFARLFSVSFCLDALAHRRFLALCCTWVALLLLGCSETATEYRMGSDGRYHKVGTVTEGSLWRRSVQEYIAKEQAGTLQKQFQEPAKQFWQSWYSDIRDAKTPFWKDPEFKTSEDMVTYIKQQRRAAGLLTYD